MKAFRLSVLMVLAMVVLAACGAEQATIANRNAALGRDGSNTQSNYAEARQIQGIEQWKDDPGKIVNMYINFPPFSDNVITVQCQGVPTSSTESLEPNVGGPRSASATRWVVPIDGTDVMTEEMAGRDGTFGDPVPFRQCLTVDGQYIDVDAAWVFTSSGLYTFPPSTVTRNFEGEVRLLQAEEIIRRGGCVNAETLVEQPCPAQPPQPTAVPNATTQADGVDPLSVPTTGAP